MTAFQSALDRPGPGVTRLVLSGDMVLGARDAMRTAFESVSQTDDPMVLLDFTEVRLVSSGAIGELVRCQSRLAASGREAFLVCPAGDVLETLMVADMHRLLPLHSDLASFLKGLPS
ncbi:MAG: STAS domain-containing protein [Fibrobacteria bacterium]|nr:STAS domain-containing protein [Fibrobacteria bacterium]